MGQEVFKSLPRTPAGPWALLIAMISWCTTSSCSTMNLYEGDDGDGKAFYTLQTGSPQEHPAPLPDEYPIFVKWTAEDGSRKSVQGFRGWDFDRDGRFEMVEVLDEEGASSIYVFDFDGDGGIDGKRYKGSMELLPYMFDQR